ncbi:MAG: hypothetical protein IKU44_03175 [Firmicutes bacterium]|nr:hypothetical protein [Bacillota bacterium]
MEMDYGIISCIPITVLMLGVLITKRITEMMVVSSLLGAILIHKGDFFSGYIDMLYGTLSNSSYHFVLFILMGFGGMIKLFQESGALLGFRHTLSKYVKGEKAPLVVAWFMAAVMFVDDYLSALAVSFSMREITDENKIPREHLAFQVNVLSACLCILIPFSSWVAFTTGLLSEHDFGFTDYLKGMPFMFYPILMAILCMLLALGIVPKIGAMKQSYQRIRTGGPLLPNEKGSASIVNLEMENEVKESSAWNIILPVAIMVAVVLIYDNDLVHGIFACIATQCVMYVLGKIMTLSQFVDHFYEGAKSMCSMAILVCFSFTLSAANQTMGFFDFLIGGISNNMPPELIPALIFVSVGLAVFATAGYWVIQIITIPVFIPLAVAVGLPVPIAIGAVMSGVGFGGNFCFYSDTVFMTAAGTGISNVRQIKVSAPYILTVTAITLVAYLVLGYIVM